MKTRDGWRIHPGPIDSTMEQTFAGRSVGEQTRIGLIRGVFSNEREFEEKYGDKVMSVEKFFQTLDEQVAEAYGVTMR